MGYHALILYRKDGMAELSPAKLWNTLDDLREDGAVKVTIDFKDNHKTGKYPTGPVYTIPSLDNAGMRKLYNWVYSAYRNGDAYCRIVFGTVPYDGEVYYTTK